MSGQTARKAIASELLRNARSIGLGVVIAAALVFFAVRLNGYYPLEELHLVR